MSDLCRDDDAQRRDWERDQYRRAAEEDRKAEPSKPAGWAVRGIPGMLHAAIVLAEMREFPAPSTLSYWKDALDTDVKGSGVETLRRLQILVNQQAEDVGLWFCARTAPEAYLQQELRKLHAAVEETERQSPVAELCEALDEALKEWTLRLDQCSEEDYEALRDFRGRAEAALLKARE